MRRKKKIVQLKSTLKDKSSSAEAEARAYKNLYGGSAENLFLFAFA